jgi:hypothetical protein
VVSQGAEPPNRRVEQRAHRRCKGACRCWLSDGTVDRFASIADVSLDGARVFTAGPPPVGAAVGLRFRLRDTGVQVRATARVIWRTEGFRGRGGVIGVQFEEVDGADEIASFIEEG